MWLFGKSGLRGNAAQERRQRGYRRRNHLSLRGRFFERLEDRRLLAITATFTGTALSFVSDGNPADSDLTINATNDAGTQVTFSSTTDTISVVGAPPAALTEINVDLGGGTDSLIINGFTGANSITIDGLDVDFGAVDYDLVGVENLAVNGQGGADTISATGITVTGALSINGGAGADTLSVNSAISTTLDVGALTVADPDAMDDVELRGTVITDALAGQDYQTDITLLGNTTLNAGAGDISFDQEVTGLLFDLQPDSSGATTFSGAVNVGGLSTFGGGQTKFNVADPLVAVTTAGNQIYNNPVLLLADTILTSTGGSIFFNDFVDAADNTANGSDFGLTVNTPLGNTFINAEMGGDNQDTFAMDSDEHGLEYLVTDASGGVSGQIQIDVAGPSVAVLTAGNQQYNDPVLLRQDTILTSSGGNITFENFVDALDNAAVGTSNSGLTVNTPAGNNIFKFEVGGDNQDLLLAPSDVDGLEFLTTDATAAGGQTQLNVAAPLIAVTATGDQTYNDQVTLGANTTLAGNDISFNSTLNSAAANRTLAVNTSGNGVTTFSGAVGGTLALASLTTNADGTTAINGGAVTTTGDQAYNDPVTLGANTTLAGNDISFNSTLNSAVANRTLAVSTSGNGVTTFGGAVGGTLALASLTTNDDGTTAINGGAVTTTGDQIYSDSVTLNSAANATTLTSTTGSVTFNSTLNSFQLNEEDLTINAGANVTFDDTVGGLGGGRLDDLDVDAGNNVSLELVNVTNTVDLSATAGAILDLNGMAVNVDAMALIAAANDGITLHTDVNTITASNTGAGASGDIVLVEEDAVTLTSVTNTAAGGNVNVSNKTGPLTATLVSATGTGGDVTLTANNGSLAAASVTANDDAFLMATNGNLTIGSLTAGDDATLSATAGSITENPADAVPDVTAADLFATARDGITLDTDIDTITASNATTGDIDIDETDGLQVNLVTATGQTVDLNAGGAITEDADAAADVIATSLILQATGGIDLDSTITDLTATNNTSGGVTIDETDNLRVELVTAAGQTVTLRAGGFINEDDLNVSDVFASRLVGQAGGLIGLDTTIDLLTVTAAGGTVDIDETNALTVESVTATGQTVDLNAGGAIDEDDDAATDVTSAALILQATGGIDLDTAIDNFMANNDVSGIILITEAFGINVLSATNDGGSIQIVAAGGPMNITTANSAGFFVGSTSDTTAAVDNLVVTGNVEAASFVSLIAGDDITLEGTSDVRSVGGFVYMKLDAASVDTAGGTLIMLGALAGDNTLQYPLVAEGGVQDDLFSIQKLPQSAIAILARDGALDNTFIVLTDAAEDVRVFATIVDLAGQSPGGVNPIEITYVDNEQLDLVTLGGADKVFVQMPEPTHGILANIVRTSTGDGDDSLKINGSTLNDVIRVNSYTTDPNYRFQVRGDTGETECLQVFGFTGNDMIDNSAPIASLLDGGNGQDAITGSDFSIHPVTGAEIYDVIFGGGDADSIFDPVTGRVGLSGRAGNDFIYADHDYNLGTPVLTITDGDIVNGGLGMDVIIALGGDSIQRDSGDFESDVVVGQGLGLSINDFLFAQLVSPSAANINQQLQAGLVKKCAMPIP